MNPKITIKNLTNKSNRDILQYIDVILYHAHVIKFEQTLALDFESDVKAEIIKNEKSLNITIFNDKEANNDDNLEKC